MTVTKTDTKKRKETSDVMAEEEGRQQKRQKVENQKQTNKPKNVFDKGGFGPLVEGKHKCLRCEWSYFPSQLQAARGHVKSHKLQQEKNVEKELKKQYAQEIEEVEQKQKKQNEREQKEKEQKEKEKEEKEKNKNPDVWVKEIQSKREFVPYNEDEPLEDDDNITRVYPNMDFPEFVDPTSHDATAYLVTMCHYGTVQEKKLGLPPHFERKIVTSNEMLIVAYEQPEKFLEVTVVAACKAKSFEMAAQALREKFNHLVIK